MDDRMRFRSANARIDQLVNDPLIAKDVQRYAEQRSVDHRARDDESERS